MSFVMVPVPEELVLEVYALINERKEPKPGAPTKAKSTAMAPSWSDEEIERAYRQSPPAMKALLDTLAAHPGEWLSTADLSGPVSEAIGKEYGWMQLAGVLGAFGRRTKSRYGKDSWFFDVERDDMNQRWMYRASPELSKFLQSLAAKGAD